MSGLRQIYVVGFMFCGASVLLVKKNRPVWQKDLWNGVGGGCNTGEHAHLAMPREFEEETGLKTMPENWAHFATELGPGYVLYCYKARLPLDDVTYQPPRVPPTNDVGEELIWCSAIHLAPSVVGNLHWMVPLARDWRKFSNPALLLTNDDITERPAW